MGRGPPCQRCDRALEPEGRALRYPIQGGGAVSQPALHTMGLGELRYCGR